MQNRRNRPGYSSFLYAIGVFLFIAFFSLGMKGVEAAPIKILNNTSHAFSTIGSTINQLLGRSYTSSEFVTDFTTYISCSDSSLAFAGSDPTVAISTSTQFSYCNSSSATTTPPIPYQIFSTSGTGNPGDSITTYNKFASYDITDDYAFTNSSPPVLKTPPAFYTAPGGGGWASAAGVEWTIDPAVFCSSSLSCLTAANTGIMAWLRFNHPTWNWFDVKAAMRQSASNWATGYSNSTYGFGQVNATTTNALTDNQILLQPPEVATSTTGAYNQLNFTVYPFRQTRRAKDVLFEFPTNPGFQGSSTDLTLAQIQTFGGTKITDYTGSLATSTGPITGSVSNAYFVWFTADNANDTASTTHFSRIDTYADFGPLSQNGGAFLVSPADNVISTTSPTFTWNNNPQGDIAVSKYELFIDGVLNKDNISGTSTIPTADLSAGTHTWNVEAFLDTGGTSTGATRTINIVPGYAPGYTFYVDNVLGNDNNPGTQAAPWATLTKAGNTAQAGDTVVIIKNANTPYREALSPVNSGTSGSPITFRGVDANTKPEIWGSNDVSGGWSVYGGGNANTYQKALTTQPQVVAAGPSISNLTKKTRGASATTLNPGEWYWISNVLYYRLASGEDITTLHVEAAVRNYGISVSSRYATLRNIVVRYANVNDINLTGSGTIVEGVEVYDSRTGIFINEGYSSGINTTISYCVVTGNGTNGIWSQYLSNIQIYNSLMYGNGGSGVNNDVFGYSEGTIRNNTSSENTSFSFSFNIFFGPPPPTAFTASNNAWDIAGDSHWDTYKGIDNQELTDSLLVSTSTRNFQLKQFSPNIDAGVAISGLTTDILGNPIYGTPDIGPYEYQPPYTVSGTVPTTGSIRVYGNGKYRMTAATSSSATANMSITPVGGFPSGDYSEWLNVTVNSWNISGDYSKSWTESSPVSTVTTVHTIGDLAPNALYTVNVDGAKYATIQANSSGTGSFTYSGGYSTHAFTLTAVPAGSISIPFGGSGVPNPPPSTVANTVATTSTATTTVPASSLPLSSTHASGLTMTQIQSILAVLTSFGVDSTTIAKVTLVLTGVPSTSARSTASTPPASSSCSFTRDLMIKMWGADIACLQRSLTARGYAIPAGATGYFGSGTKAAVAEWQKAVGIAPTQGYFGPLSRTAWNKNY